MICYCEINAKVMPKLNLTAILENLMLILKNNNANKLKPKFFVAKFFKIFIWHLKMLVGNLSDASQRTTVSY